ncbi:monofunctional biosynthetic peptidoglycan transglycosylase [Rhizobium taibaishanense]|uniref:Biosynthetic peptidoglycan transglycosylase n=1 Tax=Allorhizobium taibaishanense TaxID=887144 RepID=A0A7W6HPH8_9HYPH|nr:monofunctional biosynthetic peptidoglycan transglycosylase [Allorhizobium taibaishanense]
MTGDDAPEAALPAQSQPEETEGTGRAEGDRRLIFLRILKALLALALLPVALMVLYLLPFIHPPSTLMLADLALFRGYDRQWVPLERISPNLIRAVMMSEDGQFCSHDGVDWVQMRSVIDDALDGEETRGASTITMQTVKNLFLWNSRSFIRKGMEIPLALIADKVWTKRRTMELYLNIAEWGPGIYGVEAASRHHFKIPAAKLSARQAALLAVSLPNPIDRNASKPGPGLRRLAAMVERRARGADPYISCVDR